VTTDQLPMAYLDREARAVLNVIPLSGFEPNARIIARVIVPEAHANRGVAERLLTEVCRDADRLGVPLYLVPVPGRHGVDVHRLVRWYGRHGFTWYPEPGRSRLYMRRPPCPPRS
jgi:GNAT superfamily N-acetyltransferase